MRLIKSSILLAGLITGAGVTSAHAGPYSYSGSTFTGSNVTFSDPTLGIVNEYTGAGLITLNGSPALSVYCVDINDVLQDSGTYNAGVDPTTDPNLAGTSSITGNSKLTDIAALIFYGTDPTAIQLAIWETEYGAAATFVPDDPTVQTDLNTYLTDLTGQWTVPSNFELLELTAVDGNPNQTMIYLMDPPPSVPEPGTLALLGGAALLTGTLRKRRRRG